MKPQTLPLKAMLACLVQVLPVYVSRLQAAGKPPVPDLTKGPPWIGKNLN